MKKNTSDNQLRARQTDSFAGAFVNKFSEKKISKLYESRGKTDYGQSFNITCFPGREITRQTLGSREMIESKMTHANRTADY